MVIAVLIGVMISIVVGVSLIPMLTESLNEATKDSEDVPEAVSALTSILPIVFAVVVILGAVAWIGGSGLGHRSTESKSKDYNFSGTRYSGKDLLERIKREEEPEEEEEEPQEEEEEEEEEVMSELPVLPKTNGVLGIPKAPPSKSKSQGKPPWAI